MREELNNVDREEMSALVGAVKEIAAAVKRMEDRLEHMDGRQARMEARQERMETELTDFRKETREQSSKISLRLNHHDRKFMDHDRRIEELEESKA